MAFYSVHAHMQVQLLGQSLSIGRPSGYVDPAKAHAAAQMAAEALAKFQVWRASLNADGKENDLCPPPNW